MFSLKNFKPSRDSYPGHLILRRLRCPLRHASRAFMYVDSDNTSSSHCYARIEGVHIHRTGTTIPLRYNVIWYFFIFETLKKSFLALPSNTAAHTCEVGSATDAPACSKQMLSGHGGLRRHRRTKWADQSRRFERR
jgi:hypothetical protein